MLAGFHARPRMLCCLLWGGCLLISLQYQTAQAAPISFADIQVWAGSGTNRAALIIQWNDGGNPASMVWGYRWNGSATGLDMIRALAGNSRIQDLSGNLVTSLSGSDPRLSTVWTRYSFGDALEAVVWNPGTNPRSRDDWSNGYWEYSIFGGNFVYDLYDANWQWTGTATYEKAGATTYPSGQWFVSPIGAGERNLVNGSWDTWNFAANFSVPALTEPAAAPATGATPAPKVLSIRFPAPGSLEISFSTQASKSYQLKKKASLSPSVAWSAAQPALTATSTVTTFVLPMNHASGREFFRLETSP